jgi:hypothetical protein
MFDPKYSRYETSGLQFTVEGPIDNLKIQLEQPAEGDRGAPE